MKFADFAYLFLLFMLLYQEIYFYLYEFDTLMWLSLGFSALKLSFDFEKVQRIVFISYSFIKIIFSQRQSFSVILLRFKLQILE